MATSVSFNGSTYSIPANREPRGWGTSLSAFLVDVANNSLSKAGGNFTLTADINYGPTYGLVLKYIKSVSSNIAQSGVIRFANNEGLAWRNAANSADLTMKINASNNLEPGAPVELTVASQASAPTYAAGRMWYDTADHTMRYFNDSTGDSVNIGQEINVKVRNTSGSTITAGQVLRVTGAVAGVPTVSLAQANSFANSRVFAIATESIANNTNGYATVNGLIKNLSLNSFSDGDVLFLSASVAGGLTATRPSAPNYAIAIGSVASNSNTTGRLIVLLNPGRPLGFGTGSQVLAMNSGGTEQEYVSSTGTGSIMRATGPAIDGYLDIDEESAPGTPAANRVRIYAKSDAKIYKKDDAGVETQLATTAEALSNPMTTSGDIIYGGVSGAATRLAGNTTTTRRFLRQLGDGTNSAAPAWDVLAADDLPSAPTVSGAWTFSGGAKFGSSTSWAASVSGSTTQVTLGASGASPQSFTKPSSGASGLLIVDNITDGTGALFFFSNNTVAEVSDPNGVFGTTVTASTIQVTATSTTVTLTNHHAAAKDVKAVFVTSR